MREVDTSVLTGIARALGIGNPATATLPVNFDDDNLQQAFDVGALIRYHAARRFQVADGWATVNFSHAVAGAGFDQTVVTIDENLSEVQEGDIFWAYSASVVVVGTLANIDNCIVTANNTGATRITPAVFPGPVVLLHGRNARSWSSATVGLINPETGPPLFRSPTPVAFGGTLQLDTESAGILTSVTCSVLGRVLPAGVPPFPA